MRGGEGAGGAAAPQGHHSLLAVTEQLKVPNEHFNASLVDGGLGCAGYWVAVWIMTENIIHIIQNI